MRDGVRNYSIGTFIWGSPIVFFVWGLPCSSNRHVTPVSVRGRKGLTCSIRAPPCPRFDTLRQTVSNRAQLFLAVYVASRPEVVDGAAPNHVSLRRAHERYLGCDHATCSYDGNATFQNRIQGHKRTISQLSVHLIKARLTIPYYNVLANDNC